MRAENTRRRGTGYNLLAILAQGAVFCIAIVSPGVAVAFQIQKQQVDFRNDNLEHLPRSHQFTSGLTAQFDDFLEGAPSTSTSVDFALDPESGEALAITARLGLSPSQHAQLSDLASLVVEWNERINLVSRKDCSIEVVFGRHVLPSVALMALPDNPFKSAQKIVDVGTGGGFPGLPLAIAYPAIDFLLVDSVGKKLKAVEDMADELKLTNVRVHHGRAEEMVDDALEGQRHMGAYDVCVGRSVAALPKFCFWVSDLLRPRGNDDEEGGKLVYIIGGEIEESLLSRALADVEIEELLQQDDSSDKRILVFGQQDVAAIAAESGEVKKKRGTRRLKSKPSRRPQAKGAWAKRDNSTPKQRGYEGFKRYNG